MLHELLGERSVAFASMLRDQAERHGINIRVAVLAALVVGPAWCVHVRHGVVRAVLVRPPRRPPMPRQTLRDMLPQKYPKNFP